MPTRVEEIEDYARESIIAVHSSGLQEVTVHFFCNCVMPLHKLLKTAAEGAGYEMPKEDVKHVNA